MHFFAVCHLTDDSLKPECLQRELGPVLIQRFDTTLREDKRECQVAEIPTGVTDADGQFVCEG